MVQGKGKGGLLSARVNSLTTFSGVPLGNVPTLARLSEAARNPQTVENRAEEQGRGCQNLRNAAEPDLTVRSREPSPEPC